MIRIHPGVKSALEDLRDSRLPRAPIMQVVHAILSAAAHQMNGTKPDAEVTAMLQRLKLQMSAPTTSYVAEGADLAERVIALERQMRAMNPEGRTDQWQPSDPTKRPPTEQQFPAGPVFTKGRSGGSTPTPAEKKTARERDTTRKTGGRQAGDETQR